MENLNITKKYTLISQALLVIAIFFVASPALAQNDPMDLSYGNPMDLSYGNSMDLSYGNPMDLSSGGNESPVINPSFAIVPGTNFSGGYSGYGSYSYGLLPNLTTYDGGFSGGSPANPRYNYPSAPTTAISNGGFSGGNSTNVASNYPLVQSSTVSSGGNNYIPLTQSYFPNNQVLAANDTPNLSSVYLSDVPYTGAGDVLKVTLFTLALILWSGFIAYVILKKRQNNQEVFASVVNTDETQSNPFNMSSDNKALENIENYARENKVLLSTSASVRLLKLERLNQINANDLIAKISKDEWVCVGESDLEKYL